MTEFPMVNAVLFALLGIVVFLAVAIVLGMAWIVAAAMH
jgi:hypothetical protein